MVMKLAQGCPRGYGCPIPGNTQSQVGRGPEQPDLIDVPVDFREVGDRWPLKVPSSPKHPMFLFDFGSM